MVTVWNSETPARPDKVETREARFPRFKGKLDFINSFLWALSSRVGTIEDQKRDKLHGQKRRTEVGQWCADFESGLMLVWNPLCQLRHRQFQAGGLQNENNGVEKTKKWFGPHLIGVKGSKLKRPLSRLTQTITSFPEHHCSTETPTDRRLWANTFWLRSLKKKSL